MNRVGYSQRKEIIMLYGAIIGDIAGSVYEGRRYDISPDSVEFFDGRAHFTDDTVMTAAVAQAILDHVATGESLSELAIRRMQEFGRKYQHRGYGKQFIQWVYSDNPEPYDSWGNGGPMRVSPCAWAGTSLNEVLQMAHDVTVVSHNHPEALKGSAAIASAIYLARTSSTKDEIHKHIVDNYYPMDFTLDTIDSEWRYGCSSQETVPFALEAFFEANSFEETVKLAISIGGDCDTNASMAAAIAEAFYGAPQYIVDKLDGHLTEHLAKTIHEFNAMFAKKD